MSFSATVIDFPNDVNGLNEVGISAGVDEFTDVRYKLRIVLKLKDSERADMVSYYRETCMLRLTAKYANMFKGNAAAKKLLWDSMDADLGSLIAADANSVTISITPAQLRGYIQGIPADKKDVVASTVPLGRPRTVASDPRILAVDEVPNLRFDVDIPRTLMVNDPPIREDISWTLYQGLLFFILTKGWQILHVEASNGMVEYIAPSIGLVPARTILQVNTVGFWSAQKCANLLVGLKLSWWLTNHHVGQIEGEIHSFVGKLAKLQNLYTPGEPGKSLNKEVRAILWSFGKIMTTRGVLRALGIDSIDYSDVGNTGQESSNDYAWVGTVVIRGSDDVMLRVKANPAGTANNLTYLAIVRKALRSNYSVCLPPLVSVINTAKSGAVKFVEGGPAIDYERDVHADPARYHMGSMFLTGQERIVEDVFAEEERENLAAFVYSTAKGTTLAKAPVLIDEKELTANAVYTTIMSIKSKIVRGTTQHVLMKYLEKMGGGNLGGGMAGQFRILSAVQITEADDEVKAEKSATAADPSAGPAVVS